MNAPELLKLFAREWEQKYGQSYPISWGKEAAQFKRLLKLYDAEYIERLVGAFFRSFRSEFVSNSGRSVGVFVSQVPALVAHLAEEDKNKPADSSDFKRIEEARRALK